MQILKTSDSAHLPLVGEVARSAQREVLSAGDHASVATAAATPLQGKRAPIIALHGVGDFSPGDVIEEIARDPSFSRSDDFRRETVFARNYRYTVLMEGRPGDGKANQTRMLEVNWSEVRRAMPNVTGLLRNFVAVLFSLNRIAVFGANRSQALSAPISTGVFSLWMVEGLMVWASLIPALSTLLWQLEQGQRFAAGLLVASVAVYAAYALRRLSDPMTLGGLLFAGFAVWAGWLTCFHEGGHKSFAGLAAVLHVWLTVAATGAVLVTALEISLRPAPAGARDEVRWLHRLSRIACLWMPLVLMVLLQPLSVSGLLLPMEPEMRKNWGYAFSADLPFDPEDVQRAVSWIALALAGTLLLGAMQFKLIQRHGRNVAVWLGWGLGVGLLLVARAIEGQAFQACDLCKRGLHLDWLVAVGVMLIAGGFVTWLLFSRSDLAQDANGRRWYPAGSFARFWASLLMVVMPLVLTCALGWLMWQVFQHRTMHNVGPIKSDSAQIFMESTKYALLLAPLATKPFAAFLDALGDVFFFLVRQRNLNSRLDTMPRLWKALQHVHTDVNGSHYIVFAHSQGTVIAAAMFSRMVRVLARSEIRLTLVTVGCPVTTLFRNFLGVRLGVEFANLCLAHPDRFRWFNLCRPADYIGGAVELNGVVNRDLLTEGDHVGYWSDRELLSWLQALSEGREA
jgi:hypothetical protein